MGERNGGNAEDAATISASRTAGASIRPNPWSAAYSRDQRRRLPVAIFVVLKTTLGPRGRSWSVRSPSTRRYGLASCSPPVVPGSIPAAVLMTSNVWPATLKTSLSTSSNAWATPSSSNRRSCHLTARTAAVIDPPDTEENLSTTERRPNSLSLLRAPTWNSIARNPPPDRHMAIFGPRPRLGAFSPTRPAISAPVTIIGQPIGRRVAGASSAACQRNSKQSAFHRALSIRGEMLVLRPPRFLQAELHRSVYHFQSTS